jgi:ABC-type Na+ efflux pump permease subunit
VLDQARDVAEGLRAGVVYSPEEIAGITGAAARLPGGAALARNIAVLGQQAQVTTALRGATPREVQDTINTLAAQKAKGGQSAVQASAQLEAALAVQQAQARGLKTDPLSYAVTQGVVELPPLDPANLDSVRARAKAAWTVKARYGGPLDRLVPAAVVPVLTAAARRRAPKA